MSTLTARQEARRALEALQEGLSVEEVRRRAQEAAEGAQVRHTVAGGPGRPPGRTGTTATSAAPGAAGGARARRAAPPVWLPRRARRGWRFAELMGLPRIR